MKGYVIIRVTGTGLEAWVNRVVRSGIPVWTVSRPLPDTLLVRVRRQDFARLRSLRSGTISYRLLERRGLPVWISKLWRRRGLGLGAIGFLLFFYLATSFVWFVDVEAPSGLSVAEIRAVAAKAGLRAGQRRDRIEVGAVERRLFLELPQVAWVNVQFRGTHALVQVAERPVGAESEARYGHIVADRDGVVVQVVTLQGEAVVGPGDTVSEGQLLISGLLPPEEEEYGKRLDAGELPYVRADGQVYARVWYESYAEATLVETIDKPTGRWERVDIFSFGSRRWQRGEDQSRFLHFREHRVEREAPRLPGLPPLRWETVWRQEVEVEQQPRSREAATAEAMSQAKADIARRRKPGAEVQDEQVEVLEAAADATRVRVRVLLETRENIASFEPIGENKRPEEAVTEI